MGQHDGPQVPDALRRLHLFDAYTIGRRRAFGNTVDRLWPYRIAPKCPQVHQPRSQHPAAAIPLWRSNDRSAPFYSTNQRGFIQNQPFGQSAPAIRRRLVATMEAQTSIGFNHAGYGTDNGANQRARV